MTEMFVKRFIIFRGKLHYSQGLDGLKGRISVKNDTTEAPAAWAWASINGYHSLGSKQGYPLRGPTIVNDGNRSERGQWFGNMETVRKEGNGSEGRKWFGNMVPAREVAGRVQAVALGAEKTQVRLRRSAPASKHFLCTIPYFNQYSGVNARAEFNQCSGVKARTKFNQ